MKKIISLVCVVVLSLCFSILPFASACDGGDQFGEESLLQGAAANLKIGGSMSLMEVSRKLAEKENISMEEAIHIMNPECATDNSFTVTASAPMSFEEITSKLAKNEGIPLEEAMEIIGSQHSDTRSARTLKYRVLTSRFTVTPTYCPAMEFYCTTDEATSQWGIVEIRYSALNRTYGPATKIFQGNIHVELESPYQIFYVVDGDFYNTGTQSGGFNAGIKLGEFVDIGFTIESSSNYFAPCLVNKMCAFQE